MHPFSLLLCEYFRDSHKGLDFKWNGERAAKKTQTEGDKRDIKIMKQAGRYTGSRVLMALYPGKRLETKGMSRFEEFALSKTFK